MKNGSPAAGAANRQGPMVFFDGVCVLCNSFVDFILARDRRAAYRFAPLQGETASAKLGGKAPEGMTSVILWDQDGMHLKSDAALRVLSGLGGPWKLIRLLQIIPRLPRDAVYDFVARNRYRWFGKRESCRMPGPEERSRFLP